MFSKPSSLESQPLRDILVKRSSEFSLRIIGAMVVLASVLQIFVVRSEQAETRGELQSWVEQHQQRLAQSLFLQNTFGPQEILLEANRSGGRIDGIEVRSPDGAVVATAGGSRAAACAKAAPERFTTDFPHGHLCYSGDLKFADRSYGKLTVSAGYNFGSLLANMLLALAMSVLLYGVIRWSALLLIDEMRRFVVNPLSTFAETMRERPDELSRLSKMRETELVGAPNEVRDLVSSYNDLIERIRELNVKDRERIELLSYRQLAAQVSHDIRSPLTALRMASADLPEVPDSKKTLIRLAVQRINDIAQSLQRQGAGQAATILGLSLPTEPPAERLEPIAELVESLLLEKRAEYGEHRELRITGDINGAYGLFTKVDGAQFKRHLSNLINNSVEAIKGIGTVNVRVEQEISYVRVRIEDQGPGIPEFVLKDLGKKIVTYGKEGTASGQGIGVLHAQQFAKSVRGRFTIESEVGRGTAVSLSLPIAKRPEWFLKSLDIPASGKFVMVDDDPSIHEVWKLRLDQAGLSDRGIELVSLYTPQSFTDWLGANSEGSESHVYLIDYEFTGHAQNGLDLIERLPRERKAVLVSSRADEPRIQARITERGLRLLPKNLARHVPLQVV